MSAPTSDPNSCACGVALESQLGQACNEEAFRYFLAVEQKRAQRSGRPFHLALVRLKKARGVNGDIDSAAAAKLFACLWLSLRETDQVGWFREGRVVGALLTHVDAAPGTDIARLMCRKIRQSLQEGLPSEIVSRVDVRVFRLPSRRRV
jgi:hypothetical protein